MGIVGFEIQSSATVCSVFSPYTIMLRKVIPKPAAAAAAAPSLRLASAITAGRRLQLCREKKQNLFSLLAARSMVNGQYPAPPEVPGTSTPPEFPTKRTDYPATPIPPEVPGLPTGPEIEINPGRELPMQPPDIPEVPNPFPGRGPEIPVPPEVPNPFPGRGPEIPAPPMPSTPPGPPDVPFPHPPDQAPPRVPPDPDILPPTTPPDIPPPDIKPPPGPSVLF